jgi:hypothetical protein
MPAFSMIMRMETRRLHNTEMKRLVRVLSGNSSPVKQDIKSLPYRIRHSPLSTIGTLCNIHRGLDHHLINDIQSWVQHEFDGGIGRYVYPVIMGGKLTVTQELKIRQLEPVLQMWRKDFKAVTSAPPGREPIQHGNKWKYEPNQCPACKLARIGSDEDVLLALYAGMISRFNIGKLVTGKALLAELDVAKLDKPKSKRVRFVRYWIKASSRGDTLLFEAAELGIKIKQLHKEWKDARRANRPSIYSGRFSLDGFTVCNLITEDSIRDGTGDVNPRTAVSGGRTTTRSSTTTDPSRDNTRKSRHLYISGPRQPSTRAALSIDPHMGFDADEQYPYNDSSGLSISKLGPQPRPVDMHSHSPLDQLGFSISRSSLPRGSYADTIFPGDSISVATAPLRTKKDAQPDRQSPTILNYPAQDNRRVPSYDVPSQSRKTRNSSSCCPSSASSGHLSVKSSSHQPSSHTSLASTLNTIISYDGGSVDDTHAVPQESVGEYMTRCGESGLPAPQRQSIYYGYGEDGGADPFEDADKGVLEEEKLYDDGRAESGNVSTATRWDELY